jgi:hypothetical protein
MLDLNGIGAPGFMCVTGGIAVGLELTIVVEREWMIDWVPARSRPRPTGNIDCAADREDKGHLQVTAKPPEHCLVAATSEFWSRKRHATQRVEGTRTPPSYLSASSDNAICQRTAPRSPQTRRQETDVAQLNLRTTTRPRLVQIKSTYALMHLCMVSSES